MDSWSGRRNNSLSDNQQVFEYFITFIDKFSQSCMNININFNSAINLYRQQRRFAEVSIIGS